MRSPFLPRVALLVAAITLSSSADEPARWNVTAECQMVVLSQKAALALLPDLNNEAKIGAAFAKIQAMIEKGDAQLVANLLAKSLDGHKATAESIEELKYPTEWDPPQLPDMAQIPKEKIIEVLKAWPLAGATPTAFETRNVGAMLEGSTAVFGDGKWLDVEITPQHIRFLRWNNYEIGVLPNGKHIGIDQPHFHTLKNTASVRLRNGQRILLGVHRLPPPDTAFELFLLRVSAEKVD